MWSAAQRGQGGRWRVRPFTKQLLLDLTKAAQTELEREVGDCSIITFFVLLKINEVLCMGWGYLTVSAERTVTAAGRRRALGPKAADERTPTPARAPREPNRSTNYGTVLAISAERAQTYSDYDLLCRVPLL